MQNDSGYFRTVMRRTTTVAKVLLVGLVVMLVSAGTIFAASQGGSQGNNTKGVTIQVNPSSRTVDRGDPVNYSVSLTSTNGFSGSVTPTVSGLPASTTAAFAPASVTLASGKTATVTLTVATSATTPDGKADLTIATAAGASQAAGVVVQLYVQSSKKTFSISGNLGEPLTPGAKIALNLSFSNPNNKSLALSSLSVTIAGITRTRAAVAAGLPCTTADYAVTNYSGAYPLTVPVGSKSLQELNQDSAQWPQIAMLDTALNQDGCKGATLQLSYSGAGEGN
ncbi:hypothetical protein [Pseudarthrobacter raffinosi]|uniref:hypothetical protein n=1 Tax=Pseudarthrobacter raffinosi TaxID=2953651 RepID=UPI00208F9138|nr:MULTISPECIES: hypothetical protein [unclassified Pseudarthrobacter]MCO4238046.1 hypothetical protein [Pseudarthrobacter sp. MDT3-28]MCO4251632.1 hypothetical protein [Pseudarthrobacter sp. MDT3-9]MCO4264519.1 hypothetical protein [Pseudarthrobacter sp. MDT3-26]